MHGPTDSALANLHAAISAPHRIPQISVGFFQLLHQIPNLEHRRFFEDTFDDIQSNRGSPPSLAKISDKINAWNDREFPVFGRRR
jgi:hypothetical protein